MELPPPPPLPLLSEDGTAGTPTILLCDVMLRVFSSGGFLVDVDMAYARRNVALQDKRTLIINDSAQGDAANYFSLPPSLTWWAMEADMKCLCGWATTGYCAQRDRPLARVVCCCCARNADSSSAGFA